MLPEYTIQKQNESQSYAIILYYMRKLGIFRNLTESDYGIDFEVEQVLDNQATGRVLKVQVKSSQDLRIRKRDGVPTVGNIKQKTLRYWAEISYNLPVIMLAVDLKSERIHASEPLFWQAIEKIDLTDTSKSIDCIAMPELRRLDAKEANNKIVGKIADCFSEPPLRETLSVHKTLLRGLPRYLELYESIFMRDHHLEVENIECFREFIEVCSFLLNSGNFDENLFPAEHREKWRSVDHWKDIAGWDELQNYKCYDAMKILMPAVLTELQELKRLVIGSGRYWLGKNPEYFGVVTKYTIPTCRTHDELMLLSEQEDPFGLWVGESRSNDVRLQVLKGVDGGDR